MCDSRQFNIGLPTIDQPEKELSLAIYWEQRAVKAEKTLDALRLRISKAEKAYHEALSPTSKTVTRGSIDHET